MSIKDRLLLVLSIGVLVLLALGYLLTATALTVSLEDDLVVVRTHRQSVAGVLHETGIVLTDEDHITPHPTTRVTPGMNITVHRAARVVIQADGYAQELLTHARTVDDALAEAGIRLHTRDRVFVNGRGVAPQSMLSAAAQTSSRTAARAPSLAASLAAAAALDGPSSSGKSSREPVFIFVQRAVPLTIIQDGVPAETVTAARSVGEALFAEGIYVYAADRVSPTLDAPIAAGMVIYLRRARPVTIMADGRTIVTRTQADTVAALLAEENASLQGKDYCTPDVQTAIVPGLVVRVTRVREEVIIEAEGIAYKTVWHPDAGLELDQQRIITPGKEGVRKRAIRIHYEDGEEKYRILDREWIDEEPVTKVIAYGTRVVIRTKQTPDGPIEYWRELRVWATYYTAATSGKERGHPQYGITRTGLWATKGIIAVDPRVIPLHTRMYVPGYGFGAAEDTGGLVLGMHIDLCFDEDDPHPLHMGWITVYLLPPVPRTIPWILPDYPKERR